MSNYWNTDRFAVGTQFANRKDSTFILTRTSTFLYWESEGVYVFTKQLLCSEWWPLTRDDIPMVPGPMRNQKTNMKGLLK